MFDLTNKTVLITGGGGLLGGMYAQAISEFGGKIILSDKDFDKVKSVDNKINNCVPVLMDITSQKSIQNVLDEFNIDVLINNACDNPTIDSLSQETKFEEMTENFLRNGLDVSLIGTFLCTQLVVNQMKNRGGGNIINIASDLGVIAPDQRIYNEDAPKPITYSISKFGIIGMTKYLSTYLAKYNIRVNSLSPGGVYDGQPNDFVNKVTNLIPLNRMADKNDYKGAIVFLCSEASSYMTGSNLIIDGGRTVW